MAKSSNNLSGIINKISKNHGTGGSARSTNLVNAPAASTGSARTAKPSRSSDLTNVSNSAKSTPNPIRFGTAPSQRTTASSSGSEWSNLLKQTVSGGITSILGGGMGIGSLVSSIGSLFGGGGGKTAPPPVVAFQLPNSQEHTLYLNSEGTTAASNAGRTGSGIYGNTQMGASGIGGQMLQYQSSQIAQAVKTALLNSSSLNDVIAEI